MPVYLLDVNVLVALAWSNHAHHSDARQWFAAHAAQGWATCPITQAGFVRISCNAKNIPAALNPSEAIRTLRQLTAHPNHLFWPDELTVDDALSGLPLVGYRQITDAYLVALAHQHQATLVTFDRAISTRSSRTSW